MSDQVVTEFLNCLDLLLGAEQRVEPAPKV